MGVVNFASTIFAFIYFGLIVLLIVSFTLFIRRILINSSKKNQHLEEIEKSLKKIQNYLKRIKMPISISTIVPFRQMIDILALVVIPLVFVIEKSVKNSASSLNHVGRRSSFGGFTWSGGHDSLLCESQFSLLIGGLAS